jgi:hypothetical protein
MHTHVFSHSVFAGKDLPRFIPSLGPTHVGASSTGSALSVLMLANYFLNRLFPLQILLGLFLGDAR